jgi:hypothetical protein
VTTVVMGNCGVGFAPIKAHQRELAIRLMEGVEDIPEVVMATGVPFNWETFPSTSTRSTGARPTPTSPRSYRTRRCACSSWASAGPNWNRRPPTTWLRCGG